MSIKSLFVSAILALALVACTSPDANKHAASTPSKSSDLPLMASHPKALLGSQLFFDQNFSKHRNQSCATCHDVGAGFSDPRSIVHQGAVSLGSDGVSKGGRNAPSAAYAALTPAFHQTPKGEFRGGQFWDGRASSLADQAGGPFLNPVEMQMSSEEEVVSRLKESPNYVSQINSIYGDDVWRQPGAVFKAITDAIAHFEMTDAFMPFDSKYDRVLRGEASFTPQEELGRTLFFSQQFTNCNSCHQLNTSPFYPKETFTNYEYRNIGVPTNTQLDTGVDQGLLANPAVNDERHHGKFKVPTLRNVAVTGPYMHNGVFQNLRTVIEFYDSYNNPKRRINPETGEAWGHPEVAQNIDLEVLTASPALDSRRVDALVAFMKTLTDQRYEHLIDK